MMTSWTAGRRSAQDSGRFQSAGKSAVILDGDPLLNTKGEKVEADGGIFFGREPGGSVWVARNIVGYDPAPRVFVKGCALGRLDDDRLSDKYYYRTSGRYLGLDAYEFTGDLAVAGKELIGARLLTDRVWHRTRLQIVWASPPESDDLPAGYDGGWAAVIMVPGDHTGLIAEGDVITLGNGPDEEPVPREYVVSESSAGARYIPEDSPYALNDSWRDRTEVFTWFVILELDPSGGLEYDERVRLETLGKYITVARGRDTRHEMWRIKLDE